MRVPSPKYLEKVLLMSMKLLFFFYFYWARSFPCRHGKGVQGNLISIVKSIRFREKHSTCFGKVTCKQAALQNKVIFIYRFHQRILV